jgi:hypothetical protein
MDGRAFDLVVMRAREPERPYYSRFTRSSRH